MKKISATLLNLLFLGGLISCTVSAPPSPSEDEVTGMIIDSYNKKDVARSRALIDKYPEIHNFYTAKVALHLKLRDGRGDISAIKDSEINSLINQMHEESRPGSSGRKDIQHYREYIFSLKGFPVLTNGECPSSPVEKACACRNKDIQDAFEDQAQFNSFLGLEALAWFTESMQLTCPEIDVSAIHIATVAEFDPVKAAYILNGVKEPEKIRRQLCALQGSYVNIPAMSGIFSLKRLGVIDCEWLD